MADMRSKPNWQKILAPYKRADNRKALFQLLTTAPLFILGWYLMWKSLEISYALTLLLAIPTVGFQVRLFIFKHDCGHGAFFTSRRANNILGFILGVVTFTPYQYWRRTHAIHHASSGNLDHRELGDVDTLTVREYLGKSFWGRLGYRLYRNPFVLLVIGPIWIFLLKHRFPIDIPWSWKKEWQSVWLTNLCLVGVTVALGETIGYGAFFAIELPIIMLAGTLGVWLFYVQHQFEDTYWRTRDDWEFDVAALEGSSFFDLPRILHWFTGNIGYHHIHHLSSKVPNYRLRESMEENEIFQHVTRLSLKDALGTLQLRLWDEDEQRLVGWKHLRALRAAPEKMAERMADEVAEGIAASQASSSPARG